MIFLFIGCTGKENYRKIQVGKYTLVGDINKDSILNGIISYYNKDDVLVSKMGFINSIQMGPFINYYTNGTKKNETQFFYGKENGNSFSYDSITGNIAYKNYYYYGKLIGPNFLYYANGKIQEYYFSNFEEENIFSCSYDSLGKVENMTNAFFTMNVTDVMINDKKESNLFLYNLQPPNFLFEYKICVEDANRKIIYALDSVSKEKVFFERVLPEISKENKYCIVLNITDSLSNKKQTLIREILDK
jgi:antitoxin component YwqK of YwqJK toxin-antitoxin module